MSIAARFQWPCLGVKRFKKMLGLSHVICRMHIHHWQYETRGHTFEGFVYPVSYRNCKHCNLAQVKIMAANSADVIWQVIEK